MTISDIPAVAAYLLCFVSVAIYAQQRLATPRKNRSSTRHRVYRQAEIGYVTCTLILFIILSSALQYAAMERLLTEFGLKGIPHLDTVSKLPAPLIATVLLTIWLPKVFLVRDVDRWVLNAFKDRANIPQEVRNRADRLTPQIFQVTPGDLPHIEKMIEDEGLPEELWRHLVASKGAGLQLSRYRLTRLLKLFGEVRKLARDPAYQRLFHDYAQEWEGAQGEMRTFCEQAATGLEKARRLLDKVTPGEYESLMGGQRETFGETSALMFGKLALFVAGAVISREDTEHGIGERLRAIGFAISDEAERTDFPLRSLTGLVLFLFLYLVVADLILRRLHLLPNNDGLHSPVPDSARPLFIVFSHAVTIGVTVWLIQVYPRLQRKADGRPRWDVYVLCVLLGAAILAMMWLGLFLFRYGELPRTEAERSMVLAVGTMVGSLCGAVAFFCDIDDSRWPSALPRRLTEGLGCLAIMAFAATLLLMNLPLPISKQAEQSPIVGAILVLFPASVAFIVGSFVPHICRAERTLSHQRSSREREPPISGNAGPSITSAALQAE